MKTIYKNPKPIRNPVKFNCFLEKETDKAFLIDSHDFKEAIWVPKSHILTYKVATKPNEEDEIYLSQWIAEVKGIVGEFESAPLKTKVLKTTLPRKDKDESNGTKYYGPEPEDGWDDGDIPF